MMSLSMTTTNGQVQENQTNQPKIKLHDLLLVLIVIVTGLIIFLARPNFNRDTELPCENLLNQYSPE